MNFEVGVVAVKSLIVNSGVTGCAPGTDGMSGCGLRGRRWSCMKRSAGKSARAIQREYRVSWTTVQKALGSAWPGERKHYPDRGSKIDGYRDVIDGWLRADLTAPRKQRHTAKRIFDRLRGEQQADVSYSRVRAYVSVRRGEILAETGRAPVEVFVPQSHRPGDEVEVDFGDVVIELRGQPVTCTLFSLRLSFSGRAVHRVFLSAGQEAFLEGPPRLRGSWWGSVRPDPLRQPEIGGLGGAGSVAASGGKRSLGGVSLPLRDRGVLLPARNSGRS